MNYEALIGLWEKQKELFDNWKKDLLANAEKLRAHVETALGAPAEGWEDPETHKTFRCVEVADMFAEKSPDEAASDEGGLSGKSMTKNMELIFGISIMLDKGSDEGQRSVFNLPVGIRYLDNALEYALFDPEKAEFIEWENDIDEFTNLIFEKVEEYFSFNPYIGPRDDLEVGFLKKH